MAGIKRFEDIEAWKEARELTRQIYRATARGGFRRDFGLRDQIQRASVSIAASSDTSDPDQRRCTLDVEHWTPGGSRRLYRLASRLAG